MHIIFGTETAQQLRDKYTVLELDTVPGPGDIPVTAYCVLEASHVVMEMASLAENVRLHDELIEAIRNEDSSVIDTYVSRLSGYFGGELDSFYAIVLDRTQRNGTPKLEIPAIVPDKVQ